MNCCYVGGSLLSLYFPEKSPTALIVLMHLSRAGALFCSLTSMPSYSWPCLRFGSICWTVHCSSTKPNNQIQTQAATHEGTEDGILPQTTSAKRQCEAAAFWGNTCCARLVVRNIILHWCVCRQGDDTVSTKILKLFWIPSLISLMNFTLPFKSHIFIISLRGVSVFYRVTYILFC